MCVRFTDGRLASVGDRETLACPAPTTIGSSSHTCQANGMWTFPLDVSGCRLPPAGADGKCATAFAEIATCPSGQTCGKCFGPTVQRPASCALFGIDCPNQTAPSDLYCDCSKYAGPPLGTPCNSNYGCASGYCDAGPNTRQTNRCMPRGNTGKRGDLCTANNQCSNVIPLQCIGLHLDGNNWVPGQCN